MCCGTYFSSKKIDYQPDEFFHEGVAVVGSMWATVAVEHGEVQQVIVNMGDTETVLILLPETQNRCTADPRQTDLRYKDKRVKHTNDVICLLIILSCIYPSNYLFLPPFIPL